MHTDIDLVTNDYIEIFMLNSGGSGDVDIAAFRLNLDAII
jgi:hypothetical protein